MNRFLKTTGAAMALSMMAAMPAHSAITTFATISALTVDNIYFKNAATNDKSANANLYSIATASSTAPGSVDVDFSFINLGPTLGTAVHNVTALFTLNSAVVNTPASAGFGYLVQPGIVGAFSLLTTNTIVVGTTTYAAGSNLLSGVFTGAGIVGPANSTSGTFDANNQNVGSTIVYTSDFVTFAPGASLDAALSLSSITPALSDVSAGTYALRTFKTDAGGSFSAEPSPTVNAAPEPASWAMLLLGFGGLGGMARRRRSHAIATA